MGQELHNERRIAVDICRKLSCRLPRNLPVIILQSGAYSNRNLKAIAYYVRKDLKKNGIGFGGIRTRELGEDFCLRTCFSGHVLGGRSPKCRGCVMIALAPLKRTAGGSRPLKRQEMSD